MNSYLIPTMKNLIDNLDQNEEEIFVRYFQVRFAMQTYPKCLSRSGIVGKKVTTLLDAIDGLYNARIEAMNNEKQTKESVRTIRRIR